MSTKIPEENRQNQPPSEEEQYRLLLETLAGSKSLALIREKPFRSFLDLASSSESPRAFLDAWDKQTHAARWLGNLIAKLKRDKHNAALAALLKSLRKNIPLPQETFDITETKHLFVVMTNVSDMLLLLRFAQYQHWMSWNPEVAPDVYEKFPKILEQFQNPDRTEYDHGQALAVKAQSRILNENVFPQGEGKIKFDWLSPLTIALLSFNDHIEYHTYSSNRPFFAFLAEDDIKPLLTQLSREVQESLGVWHIEIPLLTWNIMKGMPKLLIGFYPECYEGSVNEEPNWSKESKYGYRCHIHFDQNSIPGFVNYNGEIEGPMVFSNQSGGNYQDSGVLRLETIRRISKDR